MRTGGLLFRGLIRRHPMRFVLIALCATICFTGLLGIRQAGRTVAYSRQQFLHACGTGDIVVYTQEVQQGELGAFLASVEGVDRVAEGVIARPVRATCTDGQSRAVRLFSFLSEDVVRPVRSAEGALLSYGYAAEFDAQAVQTLTFANGETLHIAGTAWMPLFTGVYVDRFIPGTDGEPVDIYVTPQELERYTAQRTVNYAVLTLQADADPAQVLDDIYHNEDIVVSYAVEAHKDVGLSSASELENTVYRICSLFPWMFLTVGTAFVCIFLSGVARRSERSLRQLLNMGAHPACMMLGLSLFGLAAVLTGLAVSLPASAMLARFISRTVLENMGMPCYTGAWDVAGVGLCLAGSLVLCPLTACIGSVSVLFEHSPKTTALSTWCLASVSTAAAVGMAACALFFMDAVDAVRNEQFTDRYNYDVQVVYDDFVPLLRLEELKKSGMTTACEPMLVGSATAICGDVRKEVTCVGLSQTPLLTVRDSDGQPMKPRENAIILSGNTAQVLGVKPGDILQLQVRYGSRAVVVTCTIADISVQLSSAVEVVSVDTVEAYLHSSGVMNSAAVKVKEGELAAFVQFARQQPGVYVVQTGEGGRQRFDERYAGTKTLMWVILGIGVTLGWSVCLLMCFVQWKQHLRRNTILTMLGAHPLTLYGQRPGIRFLGMLTGWGLGMALAVWLMPTVLAYLSTPSITYPFVCRAQTVLLCGGLCLLYEVSCQIVFFTANRMQDTRLAD